MINASGYSIVEAQHGLKGGAQTWELVSTDGKTIIVLDANVKSQITRMEISVYHTGQKSNVTDDLDVIQTHIIRILPNEPWTNLESLGWTRDNLNVPTTIVHKQFALELSCTKDATVLVISPEMDSE